MRSVYSCVRHGIVSGEQKKYRCTKCVFTLSVCERCADEIGIETLNETLHLHLDVIASDMRCPSCLVEQKRGKRISVGTLKPYADYQSKGRMENRERPRSQQDEEGSPAAPSGDKSKPEKA